jgi:hypothetical protein
MRDILKSSWWENLFPQNPTQTRYDRFMKGPGTPIRTDYDEALERFDRMGKTWGETHYDDFLEKLK